MKKRFCKFLVGIIVIFTILSNTYVYADEVTESNWVKKAFNAAYSFLKEDVNVDSSSASGPEKMVGSALKIFKDVIKAINIVLLVALFAISVVSISIVGIRYMMFGDNAKAVERAKSDLHTTFIGMAYGFGAFLIWNIAMTLVVTIIEVLAE